MATATNLFEASSAIADFRVRHRTNTPEGGTELALDLDYGRLSASGAVVDLDLPANEVPTSIIFLKPGTTDPVAGDPTYQRLGGSTVVLRGLIEDADLITTSSKAVLEPDLSIKTISFNARPGVTKTTPQYEITSTSSSLTTNHYLQIEFYLPPGALIKTAVIFPSGWSNGNAQHAYAWSVYDSEAALLAGVHVPSVGNLISVRDEDGVIVTGTSVDNQNQRGPLQPVVLTNITVPANGVVRFRLTSHSNLRIDSGGQQYGWIEVVTPLAIAATERVQQPRQLVVSGAMMGPATPGFTSQTEATIYDNFMNTVFLLLDEGKNIDQVVPTDCIATLGPVAMPGEGVVMVTPTGPNPAIAITQRQALTYQGFMPVGEWGDSTWENGLPVSHTSLTPLEIGIDLNQCHTLKIVWLVTSTSWLVSGTIDVRALIANPSVDPYLDWHDAQYMQVRWLDDSYTEEKGRRGQLEFKINGGGSGWRIVRIEGWASGMMGSTIPVGTTIATKVNLTANGGADTVNGQSPYRIPEEVGMLVKLGLNQNEFIQGEPTISVGTLNKVGFDRQGLVWVEIPSGSGDADISYNKGTAVANAWNHLDDLEIISLTNDQPIDFGTGKNFRVAYLIDEDRKMIYINGMLDWRNQVGGSNGSGFYAIDVNDQMGGVELDITSISLASSSAYDGSRFGKAGWHDPGSSASTEGWVTVFSSTKIGVIFATSGTVYGYWAGAWGGVSTNAQITIDCCLPIL